MADAESLAQPAVERLSEDETLRGDLTDDGFGPLLEWAANAAIAYATNLKSNKPEEAMDAYAARLKGVIQAVVAAAEAGKIEDAAALLDFEAGGKATAQKELAGLGLKTGEADDNAVKIAGVLAKALTQPAETAPTDPRPPATTSSPAVGNGNPSAKTPAVAVGDTKDMAKTEISKPSSETVASKNQPSVSRAKIGKEPKSIRRINSSRNTSKK